MERRAWPVPLQVAVLLFACAASSQSASGVPARNAGQLRADARERRVEFSIAPRPARVAATGEYARARALQESAEAAIARARFMRDAVAIAAVVLLLAGAVGGWIVSRRRDAAARIVLEREIERRARELEEAHERRRQLELEMDRQRRLEAVGRLTGGVAHDYNNLMTIVRQCCDLLLLRPGVAADAEAVALVTESGRAASAAGDISQSLLAFARQRPLECAPFAVEAHLETVHALLERACGAERRLEVIVTGTGLRVEVDPGQLTTVLINLVVNARDATPAGSRILVTAGRRELPESAAARTVLAPGRYVAIEVRDDGTGMQPEIAERAIEPFFTTKGPAAGTGLGLSISHGFATQAGGDLRISSQLGIGTTVTLLLPEIPDGR